MKRLILIVVLAVAVQLTAGQNLFAQGADVSLDFAAAAPLTYNHQTGGGAYNDGSVGRDKDIVGSLEGGDFKCGDIVTFFVQVRVNSGAFQTITMNFVFDADTTGQSGAAHIDVLQVATNCNDQCVENGAGCPTPSCSPPANPCGRGRGFFGNDTGCVQEGPYSATITSKILPPAFFVKDAVINLTAIATTTANNGFFVAGDKLVVRIDSRLGCNGQRPTGNLLAKLTSASVDNSPINVGSQTIPLKVTGLELP
jgi:hypothetical protein